jgi:tRNA-Thr(GGU) m(6)t(6)A37 methyltransferase TsaA
VDDKSKIDFLGYVVSTGETSRLEIREEYRAALLGLERFSHLHILYWLHERDNQEHRKVLQVTPPRHKDAPLSGVFASRSPSRPNPLGLTVVKLVSLDEGTITVEGFDANLGSPIVDIKPYIPSNDSVPGASTPDYFKKHR